MSNDTNQLERLWKLQTTCNKLVLDGARDPEKLANILQAFKDGSVLSSFSKPRWREQDGVIYLTVGSNGRTGPHWISSLEKQGFRLSKYAKSVLLSPDFKPTTGVMYEIAILKGMLFEDDDRITSKIRGEGALRKLTKPNAEVACLIRENFSDGDIEAMGLWTIVAMHDPINDSVGSPYLLSASRNDGGRRLSACYGRPGNGWDRDDGFAFVVSQVGS